MFVKVIHIPVFESDYDLKSEEYEVWDGGDWLASFRYEKDAESFASSYRSNKEKQGLHDAE